MVGLDLDEEALQAHQAKQQEAKTLVNNIESTFREELQAVEDIVADESRCRRADGRGSEEVRQLDCVVSDAATATAPTFLTCPTSLNSLLHCLCCRFANARLAFYQGCTALPCSAAASLNPCAPSPWVRLLLPPCFGQCPM